MDKQYLKSYMDLVIKVLNNCVQSSLLKITVRGKLKTQFPIYGLFKS